MAFLGIGFDPKWQVADVPIMPKNRYKRAPALAQQLQPYGRRGACLTSLYAKRTRTCWRCWIWGLNASESGCDSLREVI